MAMLLHFLLSSALLFHPVVTEIHDIRLRHDRIKKVEDSSYIKKEWGK